MNLITTIDQLSTAEKILIFGTTEPGHHIIELDESEQKAIEMWRKIPADNRLNVVDYIYGGIAQKDNLAKDELNAALAKEGAYDAQWYE